MRLTQPPAWQISDPYLAIVWNRLLVIVLVNSPSGSTINIDFALSGRMTRFAL